MNSMNIIPFQFESNNIRVIDQDGEPWFVAKDVAELLGYKRARDAIRQHCKGAVFHRLPSEGNMQDTYIIPERDVYRLIMRSKLPAAERFEEWVVDEVLPSIRKKGSYSFDPSKLSRMEIIRLAAEAEEEKLKLKALVEANEPKVEVYHHLADSNGSVCLTDAAKTMQIAPRILTGWMSTNGWLYRRVSSQRWVAYQDKIQKGLLIHKAKLIQSSGGDEIAVSQVRVTPEGMVVLREQFGLMAA